MQLRQKIHFITLLGLSFYIPVTMAGGFFSGAGSASNDLTAGPLNNSAGGYDSSTAFTNPAALTLFNTDRNLAVTTTLGFVTQKFNGTVAVNFPGGGYPPLTGVDTENTIGVLPSIYYSMPINQKLVVALGSNTPFGSFSATGGGNINVNTQYYSTFGLFLVNDMGVYAGYQVTDKLSVGGGVALEYMQQKQTSEIPVGGGHVLTQSLTVADFKPAGNLGVLYQLRPQTRLGVNYRFAVSHRMTGGSSMQVFGSAPASIDINLPAITSLSLHHEFNNRWGGDFTVEYEQWAKIQSINVMSVATSGAKKPLITNYRNTWNVALGSHFQFNPKWRLYGAFAYSEAIADIPAHASPVLSLSEGAEYQYVAGADYQYKKDTSVKFGYGLTIAADHSIDSSIAHGLVTANGHGRGTINAVFLQITV